MYTNLLQKVKIFSRFTSPKKVISLQQMTVPTELWTTDTPEIVSTGLCATIDDSAH